MNKKPDYNHLCLPAEPAPSAVSHSLLGVTLTRKAGLPWKPDFNEGNVVAVWAEYHLGSSFLKAAIMSTDGDIGIVDIESVKIKLK